MVQLTWRGVPRACAWAAAAWAAACWAQAARGQLLGGGTPPAGPDASLTPQEAFQRRVWEAGGPQYLPEEGRELVADVAIRGASGDVLEKLRAQLQTRKNRRFDPEVLQADVRRLLTSGLVRDVRPYVQRAAGGVVVTFEVVEQPTVQYVRFLGNRQVGDKTLAREANVKAGDPISPYAVREAQRALEAYYRSKGFPQASVRVAEGLTPGDRGVVFLISEGELQRIFWVRFEGNTFVSDARLRTQIQSKPGILWYIGGQADRAKIEQDVERLTAYYRSFGFFRARVSRQLEYDASGRWLTLTFVIDEGPRYKVRSVSVVGNQRFSSEELLSRLELQPGDYFNLGRMKRDEFALRDLYGGHGHIFAEVEASPRFLEQPGQLDLVYKIAEGDQFRVGRINVHIEGEYPHTRQNVVLNRISLRPGEVIDIREVRKSERRLKASQLFELDPARGVEPKIVIRPPDLGEAAPYRGQGPGGGG